MAGTGNTVVVACKLPGGIILRNFVMEDGSEPVLGGGARSIKVARQVGERITIKGVAQRLGAQPTAQIVGGYALTPGVDADFFAKWLKDNADLDAVKNRLIFAHEKDDGVQARAKENSKTRSGLEPLNPERIIKDGKEVPVDPRVPAKIERAERPA